MHQQLDIAQSSIFPHFVPETAQGGRLRVEFCFILLAHQLFYHLQHRDRLPDCATQLFHLRHIDRGNDDLLHGALVVLVLWPDAVCQTSRSTSSPIRHWLPSVSVGRNTLPSHLWERCGVRLQPVPWRRFAVHASALNAAAAPSSAVRSSRRKQPPWPPAEVPP